MNTGLKDNEICLASSPALLFTRGMPDVSESTVAFRTVPSLEEMLDEIGPLPKESLFLGQAEDELPVLLDLSNPLPGPLLIAGDAGAGKTGLLRVMARYIVSTHAPEEIQFGVITSCLQEWQDLKDVPHCAGVFPVEQDSTVKFIRALALWTAMKTARGQSVLLMIDGLAEFTGLHAALEQDMQTILLQGPAKQIWPIATLDSNRSGSAGAWLKFFRTRVFGYTAQTGAREDIGDLPGNAEPLSKGTEFRLNERSQGIKFRTPAV